MTALNPEFMAQFRAARPSVPAVLKWIEALRSGKYNQSCGLLHNNGALCCLGVAGRVFGFEDLEHADTSEVSNFLVPNLGFEKLTDSRWYETFVVANDVDHWSFDQIADWLEIAINLQRTIDLLKALPYSRFNMETWRGTDPYMSDDRLMHSCGTTACIAGWAAIFDKKSGEGHAKYRAQEALGLNYHQANELFEPGSYYNKDRERAIAVLERFRDEGVIQW